jgi:hypothetical protein
MRDASALIFVQGPMGVGKSTFSLSLAEEISKEIAWITHKGIAEDYFSMDNLRTVDRDGGLDILTSEALLKPHSVLIIDDARISADSTKFQTKANSVIRDIATIMRPFRGVLIVNSVAFRHIDKGLRELANYVITIIGSNVTTKQSFAKIYKFESGEYHDIKKFLTWTDKFGRKHRIVFFIGGLPSKKLMDKYKTMRMDNSIELIEATRERFLSGEFETGGKIKSGVDGRSSKTDTLAEEHGDEIRARFARGQKPTTISREMALTPVVVSKALAKKSEGVIKI